MNGQPDSHPVAVGEPAPQFSVARGGRQRKLLTEPDLFEEVALPTIVRAGLLSIAAVVVLFFIWASLVEIDEVATAPGQVVPSGSVKVVQHLEGGTVTEILVKNGEMVQAGQVLARIDAADARASLDEMRARRASLTLRAERLNAILEDRDPDFSAMKPKFPALAADQRRIWEGQIAAEVSAVDIIDSQIEQRRRELKQLADALAIAQRQLALTSDQVTIRERGVASGVVSRQVYLETARAQVTAEGEVLRLREQINVARDGLVELETRRRNLGATQRQDALSELGVVSSELEQVKSMLFKFEDRVERLEIRSPVTGLVQDLKVKTVGEVLPAGGLLMTVVPVDAVLEAEVRISTSDIGHVQVGQGVKVKVSTYDYTRYGMLPGTLSRISPTTFTTTSFGVGQGGASGTHQVDDQGKPYYVGIITMSRPYVGPRTGENPVLPGMLLQADIVTGRKVLAEYLFKPIVVSLKNAFHER